MTYDPQIPLVTESPKTSASPVQVNFDQFAAIFSKLIAGVNYNHMPFNNAQQGKHAAVLMQNQTTDLGVTEDLDVLYSKNATSNVSTEPQLFVQIPKFLPTDLDSTDAPNNPMQLTYNSVGLSGPLYYSFIPGGYLIYFGNILAAGSPETITLSPIPTEIVMAIATPNEVETDTTHQPIKISVLVTPPDKINVYTSFTGARRFNFFVIARA